jgi:hypothetical protein
VQPKPLETRALLDAEQYLHRLRVPSSTVDEMFEHASTEIHWLTDDELRHELGERPSWYEEFLIARYGLDKATEEQFLRDPDNETLFKSMMRAEDCGRQLTRSEIMKALNVALAPYRARLAEQQRGSNSPKGHQAVWTALSAAIPNWRQINTNAEFTAWLDHDDGFATMGQTKRDCLRVAFHNNETALVVAIFKAYIDEKGGRPPG